MIVVLRLTAGYKKATVALNFGCGENWYGWERGVSIVTS